MGLAMGGVAILAAEDLNNVLVISMIIFLTTYQLTLGTYGWVYIGQVACDEALSMATFTLWGFVLILSLVTDSMFSGLGNAGTFAFFSVCSLASSVFFFFFLREIKGMSREQA